MYCRTKCGNIHVLLSFFKSRYKIFENGTLKMTKLHLNDSADYSCEVSTLLDHVTAKGSITVLGVWTEYAFSVTWATLHVSH